jgi:hypothetical protein
MSASHPLDTIAAMQIPDPRLSADGRSWVFPTGEVLPVVRGGDEPRGGGQGGQGGQGDGGASSQGGDQGGQASGSGGESDPDDAAAEGRLADAVAQGDEGTVTMSQADLDALINRKVGKARSKSEEEFKAWLDRQAMDDTARAQAEKADAEKAVAEAKREVLETRAHAAAERLAIDAGVPAKRAPKFLRALGLNVDDITSDEAVDEAAIRSKIEAELQDDPAWKTGSSNGGGSGASGGEFNQGDGRAKVWTRAEVAKLTQEEYEKHEDEILAQVASGGIK